MRNLLLILLACCLLFSPACTPDEATPPADPYGTFTPLVLPTAETVAETVTVTATPTELSADALADAVDAEITRRLADKRICVTEPVTAACEVQVRYLATLREPLTEREIAAGLSKTSLVGEAILPAAADPTALLGRMPQDTEILLERQDPALFGLTDYAEHTFTYYVDILSVRRAPKTLGEIPNPTETLGMDADRYQQTITAELRGAFRWQAWLDVLTVSAPPETLVDAICTDYIDAHKARHAIAGSPLSFDAWLAAHTDYPTATDLEADAARVADQTARELLAACYILDTCLQARDALPAYASAALALAEAEGLSTARYWSWQHNGTANGWLAILRAFCIPRLAAQS